MRTSTSPRPLLADLCVCALLATLGSVAAGLGKQWTEDVYFSVVGIFPHWVLRASLAAGAVAWLLMGAYLGLARRKRQPLSLWAVVPAQLSLGLAAGWLAHVLRLQRFFL